MRRSTKLVRRGGVANRNHIKEATRFHIIRRRRRKDRGQSREGGQEGVDEVVAVDVGRVEMRILRVIERGRSVIRAGSVDGATIKRWRGEHLRRHKLVDLLWNKLHVKRREPVTEALKL